jgi:hypothetical protein
MQLPERVSHATPVGYRLGRSALYVFHYYQTVREQPAASRRDRHWNGHTFKTEVLEQLGFPSEINVGSGAETTDGDLPMDANAPNVVGNPASKWFDTSGVFTPLPEGFPSHWL